MLELIKIEQRPAKLGANFEEFRAELAVQLSAYDVVVTEDGLAEAKKLSTELNKTKAELDARRKEAMALVSEPIKAFDAEMRELVGMVEDGRQKILSQIQKFESAKVEECREKLRENLAELYSKHGIREEFQTPMAASKVDGFACVSGLTKTGRLAASVRTKVETVVGDALRIQQQTDLRISQLENESHRAGLLSPLTREHVDGILFTREEEYRERLEKLIARELERQEVTAQKVLEAQPAPAPVQEQPPEIEEVPDDYPWPAHYGQQAEEIPAEYYEEPAQDFQEPIAPPAEPGTPLMVSAVFEVLPPAGVTREQVEDELRRKLAAAGVTTLQRITIVEKLDF